MFLQKKEYDIIKMVQHGKYCERIQDTVSGQQLIYWVKYHPQVEKESLWQLIRNLLLQITWFHKHGEKQTYGYLTPYSVIVKEDGEIYLLDTEAEDSRQIMRQIQSRTVRNYFVNAEIYRQKGICEAADIYGFGKTVQYLLSQSETNPPLTKREEYRLAKMIQNCLESDGEKGFTDFQTVQKYFLKWHVRGSGGEVKKKTEIIGLVCAAGILLWAVIGQILPGASEGAVTAVKERENTVQKKGRKTDGDTADTEEGEKTERSEKLSDAKEDNQIVYKILEGEKTVEGQIAAMEKYLEGVSDDLEKEEMFLCLIQYYEGEEKMDEAAEICRKARRMFPHSESLALKYLEVIWKVKGVEPEMKERATKNVIQELPELQNTETFRTLKQAYGF